MALPPENRAPKPKKKQKLRKKKPAYTLPKTYRPEVATDHRPAPKKGPVRPQQTGGKSKRPQPVQRKRDAPAAHNDTKSDADRARGKAESEKNIREARLRYLRRTAYQPSIGALVRTMTGGTSSIRGNRGRDDLPGATVEFAERSGALGVPGKAATGTGLAFAHAPGKTSLNTAKGLRDAVTGIPAGLVDLGVETYEGAKQGEPWRGVEKAGKEYGQDLERRYGPLTKPGGIGEFAKRVEEEGAAAEVLDASTLIAGAGGAAGRGLSTAAKTGKLGDRAERVATTRPKLRVSGGEAVKQEPHPNLIVAAGQAATDTARKKVRLRRVKKAEKGGTTAHVLDVEAKEGEVVPIIRSRLVGTAERKQRRSVARDKGRALHAMKAEQAREIRKGTNRNVASLSRRERDALKASLELGIRDPETARRVLRTRREKIEVERERHGTDIPRTLAKTNDEIPVLERLDRDAEKAFTPRVAEVADQERRRAKRLAQNDPALAGEQIMLRTYAKQASHLGVRRGEGEDAAAFVSRVRQAAKQEGLADPAYFPSSKRPTVRHSDYAVGGTKAVQEDKRYTGVLYEQGREDVRPEALSQALARNVKRKHNWSLVAGAFDRHTFHWSKGKSIEQIRDELDRRGIDPESVALWNAGRFQRVAENAGRHPDAERTGGEEMVAEGITEAVDQASGTLRDVALKPDAAKEGGWALIPRGVFNEIQADTRP